LLLTDTHCHLDLHQFDEDRAAVIERAEKAGLVRILIPAISVTSSLSASELAESHSMLFAAVGVQPNESLSWTENSIDGLRALVLPHPLPRGGRGESPSPHRRGVRGEGKVVAIGEIGLDYYDEAGLRDLAPRPVQRRAFADQLALAKEMELPVVIHSRDAHDDVLDILHDWTASPPDGGGLRGGSGVLHSYAAGPERLDEVLEMGFYVGISGPVTFKKAERLREVAAKSPLNRLLIETDCPYLTPEPYRGKRNEPAHVRYVAQTIAHARNVTQRKIALATTENARRLFGIDG
jgi:TatD DNase family protein